ncbi:MAG: hypothetical protein R3B95_11470 [Nitrospirales bacterium]|nr:hypothetical protein [Nitrospirales bacterium]
MAGHAPFKKDLKAELDELAEDEPELCREILKFVREPDLYGRMTINRGGMEIQWDVTRCAKKRKLTIR